MQAERYAVRDRSYGIWHRMRSIARYLDPRKAASLTMADLDSVLYVEYSYLPKLPLCLIEVAQDVGQEKTAGVAQKLAEMAGISAYVALYTHAAHPNPSSRDWPDIERFRVKRLWPQPEPGWRVLTPAQWAHALVQIRGWQLRRFEVREAANDKRF